MGTAGRNLELNLNIAIIFAGGVGQRLSSDKNQIPKQFIDINSKPVIVHTLEIFQKHKKIDKIYISVLAEYMLKMQELIKQYSLTKVEGIVKGGKTAQDSIYNALLEAKKKNMKEDIVLIHDGVRPVLEPDVITRNIEGVKKNGNAITCIPAYETVLISFDGENVQDVPFRKDIYIAQAPQSFKLGEIIAAHEKLRTGDEGYVNMIDSCTIYNYLGRKTYMVKGNFGNIKITTPEDLYVLEGLLKLKQDRGF